MIPSRTTTRLVQLFERDLRDADPTASAADIGPEPEMPRSRRPSQELESQIAEYAAQVRTSGSTPEQMLVQLKTLLGTLAPDVPGSERSALLSSVTGRAIEAFFNVRHGSRRARNDRPGK